MATIASRITTKAIGLVFVVGSICHTSGSEVLLISPMHFVGKIYSFACFEWLA